MNSIRRGIVIISIVAIMITTIIVVHAQELSKQLTNIDKVKQFLNVSNIEILDNYTENGIRVFKVHDEENDEYFKLALNDSNDIDWYDNVKYGEHSKIGTLLQNKLNNMSENEKIDVMVELNFDYFSLDNELKAVKEKYNSNLEKLSTLSDSNIEKIKVEKLEYIKNKMSEYNKLSGDYEISYVSQYSPFIFLRVNKSELNQLMEEDKIYEINYIENAQFELSDASSGETRAAIQNNAITATRTNVVKNSGMTGSGVKIGQIELANPNTSNSTLTGKSITKRTTNCSTSSSSVTHATEVTGILVGTNGVAPSASLYSACVTTGSQLPSAVEWLISQDVDIINMSAGIDGTSYTIYDRYIDAITYMNDILYISAAGNKIGVDPENMVSSPSYAYNVLTIGNITYEGTSYVDAMSSSRNATSYYTNENYGERGNKPEMVAPGTNVNYTNAYNGTTSGNSFSAPLVAGASALLMQGKTSTKDNFQAVKAALFATARPMNNYGKTVSNNTGGWLKIYEHYNNQVGLGILDTKATYDLLQWGQFRNATVTGGKSDTYIYNNTLGNGMDVRVAITWSKPNTATSIDNITNHGTDKVADLDLHIIGPNGEQIVKSRSTYDNVEWVQFVTAQGYGTYKFKVVNFATNGNSVPTKVSMAWW